MVFGRSKVVNYDHKILGYEMENFTLYSQTMKELPEENIAGICDPNSFLIDKNPTGSKTYDYEWPNVRISITAIPKNELEEHLKGFVGYVYYLSNQNKIQPNPLLINRILSTKMVLVITVEPCMDSEGIAEEVIGIIRSHTESLMFYCDRVYDEDINLLLSPI